MDKSAIKNFAVNARVKLKEQIEQKAYTFGITKNEIKTVEMFEDAFEVNSNKYNKRLLKHRESLVKKINEKGFDQVLEEVAYTWFNRLIAIRFMEVNEYLPTGVRVLSSADSSKVEPDIIREAANLDFENLNIDLIYKLQDENNTEELFKYLLIKQCNELGKIMPVVFEEIEDFTELLLPDNLLQEGSIIRDLVTSITEDDWKEQVEIIGWLYQYYISEKKDEVFADLKKNKKITKENIPAATQLFTPDWIVKYMVENSLGRLWLESHPDEELKSKWKYYLEEAEQEPEVMKQLQVIREKNKDLKPEDIKVIDCCMGSGHILVYCWDVLYDIYKSAGYSEREIPKLILENNLYGLDIDDRAAQFAYFAVMMKARSYNRRIFREKIDLNICSIQESNGFPKEAIDFLVNSKETEIEERIHRDDIEYLINVFNDSKEYGSILEVKEIDFDAIERRIEEIRNGDTTDIFEWQYKNIVLEKIPDLIKQGKILSQKYDVVCTNPPYMGSKGMTSKLSDYIKNNFIDSKSDMFSVFIEKCRQFTKLSGFYSMITQPSVLFLSSFEKLRRKLVVEQTIYSLLHMGRGIFGIDFGSTSFTIRNYPINNYNGSYFRLHERTFQYIDSIDIEKLFINAKNDHDFKYNFSAYVTNENIEENNQEQASNKNLQIYFQSNQQSFIKIPGSRIAYWANEKIISMFEKCKKVSDYGETRIGMATADNNRFVRMWYEIDINKFEYNLQDRDAAVKSNAKWFPFSKGGEFRKWYGNKEYVVNWENNGSEIRNFKDEKTGRIRSHNYNLEFLFMPSITWSAVTSYKFAARELDSAIFGSGGSVIVDIEESSYYTLLGFLNTNLVNEILSILSSTLNYEVDTVGVLPVNYTYDKEYIEKLVKQCIQISKSDWDSFEISWDYTKHPILKNISGKNKLRDAFNSWNDVTVKQINMLKNYEEDINKSILIATELIEKIKYNIDKKDITISIADSVRDIKSFISYAVGCMFGRYSLDEEGLIYAGGQFNPDRYKTFKVDIDNIIPITDDEYFEDDIVSRFVEFVKITFSVETLEENLDYIADTLGKKGNETSRQTIRRYFLKDFYKDHLQTYQRRPIYWIFDSGKNDGLKALTYMHRYDIGTVARVRTDYLHLLQRKYEAEVNRLDMVMENSNASAREKTEARKKKEKIQKQILECIQYDQVIAHVANQKISIDLDDGVVVNYGKFQGVEVPQGEGKKALKADLLAKI